MNTATPAVTEANAYAAIRIAQMRLDAPTIEGCMRSSAVVALECALSLFEKGDYFYAARRAVDSLRYTVGCFHVDHERAMALSGHAYAAERLAARGVAL